MDSIVIDYNPKTGRFIISSPPWLVDKMRAIPNRRWDGKTRCWTAPAIKTNAKYMETAFPQSCYTDLAKKALEDAKTGPVLVTSSFPSSYVFKTKPFNHQKEALNKMFNQKCFALFMEMRTGKSKTFIDYASAHNMSGEVDTVVVVCPYSIRKNWEEELKVHCPVPYSVHLIDTSKPKLFDKWVSEPSGFRWLIVGVESLATGSAKTYVERLLLTSVKSLVGVDESSKIKNHSANRSKVCVKFGRMSERRVIMTGTPIANGPMDIYMQFEFLDPNIIGVGDFYSFRNRYAVMGGFENKQIIGYQNMEELTETISQFTFQVSRKDVFDLPPKMYTKRVVTMNPAQKKLYASMSKNKTASSTDGSITVQTVLEKMLRLQQISGGVCAYDNPSGTPKFIHKKIEGSNPKIVEMMSLLEEVEGSVIIWCVYREEIEMVCVALRDRYGHDEVVEIHGGIDEETRHDNVYNKFQIKKARFIVGNAATGGMGLKMSAAGTVIYYSNSFNFTDRCQSEDRTQSSDQTKNVLYVDLVCEGTVDELVIDALNNKMDVSDYVRRSINEVHKRLAVAP